MQNPKTELLDEVISYYASKIALYGDTPRGVDWNSIEGQLIRFKQLCRVINEDAKQFSIIDVGCGYGAFLDYLTDNYSSFSYLGLDLVPEMIDIARRKHLGNPDAKFLISSSPNHLSDYSIASGIFNVRQGRSNDEWLDYVKKTLELLNETSKLGFAFNCLSSYSDADKMSNHLYYADPCVIFDICKRRYSQNVALLHDYGIYEFTILVRKTK